MTQAANCFFSISSKGKTPSQVPLTGTLQIIGRSPLADITLADQTISRQHAQCYTDAHGNWWVKDLQSRNGTRVNGTRITQDHPLQIDDAIQIEQFTLLFQCQGEFPTRKPKRPGTNSALNVSDHPTGPITRFDAQHAPPIDAQHIQTLIQFAQDLLQTPDAYERQLKLARILITKTFHGISAVMIELDLKSIQQIPTSLIEPQFAHNWRSDESPYISDTLLKAVKEHQAPVIASNATDSNDKAIELSLANDKQTLAAMACPVLITESTMQVLYANFPASFGTNEWLALATLAVEQFKQTNSAWEARHKAQEQAALEKELQQASKIQNALIPLDLSLNQADVSIGFEPCKYVGGDYVDVLENEEGKIYITLCDVCGKGLQAAIVTASLHALFHTAVDLNLPLTDLMLRFNKYLMQTLPVQSFVTAVMMIYDANTQQLESCNAGHPPVLILKPDGTSRKLAIGLHPPLGFIPTEFNSETTTLQQDELLCLYTDGLTESINEDEIMLEIEGVQNMLSQVYLNKANADAQTLQDKLTRKLDEYEGNAPRADDRTFMLLKAPRKLPL